MTLSPAAAHRMDMRVLRSVVAAAVVAVAAVAAAQTPVDIERLGPQPGAKVPEFSAPDHTGTTRTLASVLGPKGAMLVFSRSADW
jgi:hypothetical protein